MVTLSPPKWFVKYATKLVILLSIVTTGTMTTIKVNHPTYKPMLPPHLKVLILLGIPTLAQRIISLLTLPI